LTDFFCLSSGIFPSDCMLVDLQTAGGRDEWRASRRVLTQRSKNITATRCQNQLQSHTARRLLVPLST